MVSICKIPKFKDKKLIKGINYSNLVRIARLEKNLSEHTLWTDTGGMGRRLKSELSRF